MTIRWLCVGMAFAAAAPAHARADPHHPTWLVGRWATVHPGRPSECPTHFTTTYRRDGRYEFMDQGGRWRINGNRLIETMTWNDGTGDDRDLNRPHSARVARLAADRLALTWIEGGREIMKRCPPSTYGE